MRDCVRYTIIGSGAEMQAREAAQPSKQKTFV